MTTGKFAAKTTTPVDKSKAEIERAVQRYGATGFLAGWAGDRATVQFRIADRIVRFTVDLPKRDSVDFKLRRGGFTRDPAQARMLWEQACRQKWRALFLLVKAKLEAVDAKITTFEESFFAHIVMPSGRTVYEEAREPVAVAYERGQSVPLLPGVE